MPRRDDVPKGDRAPKGDGAHHDKSGERHRETGHRGKHQAKEEPKVERRAPEKRTRSGYPVGNQDPSKRGLGNKDGQNPPRSH